VVRAYLEDPLVFRKMTTSLGAEMMNTVARTSQSAQRVSVPMLILHGEDDRLCPIRGSERFFEDLDVAGSRFHGYPGLRHEIFNEPERARVLADLCQWLRDVESAR
jgi:alpha-beta hydrolase superfamily lysophospholipase